MKQPRGERKVKARRARDGSQAFARLTLDALPGEVCVVDGTGEILFTNAAWRAFARENQGNPDSVLEGANYLAACRAPGARDAGTAVEFTRRFGALLRGEVESFSLEYDCHSPAQQRWFVVHAARFLDRGRPRVVVSHLNVTDRRRAEDEVRVREEELHLASRLASLGTLVAGIAHEINNPLAGATAGQGMALEALQGLAERARRGEVVDPDRLARDLGQAIEDLQTAQAGARRIARIVKDLSTIGRPDPTRIRIRVLDAVDEALRWLPGSMPRGTSLRVENHQAPDVVASSGQLSQVLVNLVANAAKSMPEGRPGVITITLGPGPPGMARIEVADNGAGIPPEVMARMFDPFFTTRGPGEGTGLGLPICHSIVRAHGGTITATSEVGVGATFRVELPAA
jgi:signal transduction histidine kinase